MSRKNVNDLNKQKIRFDSAMTFRHKEISMDLAIIMVIFLIISYFCKSRCLYK